MALEFQELKQGLMTFAQYDAKFTQLSRSVGELVRNEAEKTKRFVKGLRLRIKTSVISTSCVYPGCGESLRSRKEHVEDLGNLACGTTSSKTLSISEVSGMEASGSRIGGSLGSSVAPVQRSIGTSRAMAQTREIFWRSPRINYQSLGVQDVTRII